MPQALRTAAACWVTRYVWSWLLEKSSTPSHVQAQIARLEGDAAYAEVCVVYAAGRTFSTDRLIVNVARRNSDGSSSPLGATTWTGNRANTAVDDVVYDDVFHDAGVAPQAGIIYQITASSGRQSLGSATFTYQPGTAPAFSTQTLVHVCTAAHLR